MLQENGHKVRRFILHYTVGRTLNTAYRIFTSPVSREYPPLNNVKAVRGFTRLYFGLRFKYTALI